MGLMMAEVMNPLQETNNNVVGEVIFYISMMIFILINGHHYIISAVVASFNVIPIYRNTLTAPVVQMIVKYSFAVFTIAIKIASPVIVSFFLVHIAEGIISRVIPNIQVFFVTQPALYPWHLIISCRSVVRIFPVRHSQPLSDTHRFNNICEL